MFQPRKWWTGLLPLALFWGWVAASQTEKFEQTLASRVQSAVAAANKGIAGPAVTVSGRDVRIGGAALGAGAGHASVAAADSIAGVRLATTELTALPVQAPYVFGASRNGNTITLTGSVPDPATRASIVAAARQAAGAGGTVDDKMQYAAGAPAGFAAGSGALVALLSGLSSGEVGATGDSVSLKGVAASGSGYAALLPGAIKLPGGFRAGSISVMPPAAPSYSFAAAHDGDRMVLSGSVPSEDVRKELNAAAKAVQGIAHVEDRLSFASGAPGRFGEVARGGLELAGKLKGGRFSYTNGAVSLSGEAPDSAAFESVRAALRALPGAGADAGKGVSPPAARTFTFAAAREGDKLVLSGQAPSVPVRDALVAAASQAAGAGKVVDRLAFASGAPDGFQALAEYGVKLAARLQSGSFSLVNNAASLQGNAPDSGAYVDLIEGMKKLPGSGEAGLVDVLAPPAKPYTFGVRLDGDTLVLSGHVPSPDLRNRLLAAAAATGKKVRDELVFASGAGDGFEQTATAGIRLATALNGGVFSLSDGQYGLQGSAADHGAYEQARQALANLPRSARPGAVDIKPPEASPFTWSASRKGDTIVLDGYAPDEAARAEIERLARAQFPGLKIENNLRVARGAPAGSFLAAARDGLRQLALLKDGQVTLTDAAMAASGQALDAAAAAALRQIASNPPKGFRFSADGVQTPLPDKIAVQLPPPAPVTVPSPGETQPGTSGGGATPPAEAVKVPMPPKAGVVVDASPGTAKPGSDKTPNAGDPVRDGGAAVSCDRNAEGIVMRGVVYFPTARAEILADSMPEMRRISEVAKKCAGVRVSVFGHTDARGTRWRNIKLSTLRTFAVKRELFKAGVPVKAIVTSGFGKDRPAASNSTQEGMAKNRRVEIIVR
ncbi:MAG: BON domain-containing protein [Beijerinckiaceae bacterium]